MNITIICEGKTESAFKESLRGFLESRLSGRMPSLRFDVHHGAIPSGAKLRRTVSNLLSTGVRRADAVIGLTDVYPAFADAADAKRKMRQWVGGISAFYPHVALFDFEAWLLPYWDRVQKLAGRDGAPFGANPEAIDHGNPPAHRIAKFFEAGKCRDSYNKPRDAKRILANADLRIAIDACPELKAFVNTIIRLCDGKKSKKIIK
jgi:hypothetical protein